MPNALTFRLHAPLFLYWIAKVTLLFLNWIANVTLFGPFFFVLLLVFLEE